MKSSVRCGWVAGWVSVVCSVVWWPSRRSCLVFCWFWSWYCGTVCLMVAARRVHGSAGKSLWWSSMLSSHIAGCRCPGGREAHLQWCAGPSELFSSGLSSWEWCCSRTRRWCSLSGSSPQCNCRTENFELRPNFFSLQFFSRSDLKRDVLVLIQIISKKT